LGARRGALGVAALAVVAAVGCLNGWVLVQAEVPLGMARAGVLPSWIGHTSSRDVPVRALLVSSGLASLLVLSNAARSTAGLLDFVLRLTTAANLWLYVGACVAAFRLRILRPVALAGVAFAIWVLWGAGLEAGGLSIVLMLSAVPFYYLALRRPAEQPTEQPAVL
jgi:APA family basic amino acid/polyamine antiporter